MHRLTLLVVVLFTVIASCKKYEEGPGISLRTKKARFIGIWQLNKWTIDGTEQELSSITWSLSTYSSGNYEKTIQYNIPPLPTTTDIEQGTWEFDKKKENVLFLVSGNPGAIPQEIIKLKNRELWLRKTDNGITEEYQYKLSRF